MNTSKRLVVLLIAVISGIGGFAMIREGIANRNEASRVEGWKEIEADVTSWQLDLDRRASGRSTRLVTTVTAGYRYEDGGKERVGSGTFDLEKLEMQPKRLAVSVNPADSDESMPAATRAERLRVGGSGWLLTFLGFGGFLAAISAGCLYVVLKPGKSK